MIKIYSIIIYALSWKNFDLTWTNISGTGSDTGSEVAATEAPDTTWRKITPVMYSARIFIHDKVGTTITHWFIT